MSAVRPRLAATERRAAVLETACRVFSQGSYRGTTTAEIAREAGVSEPILYRHFASKRDLYLACIDEAWRRVRVIWEAALQLQGDGPECFNAMGRALHASKEKFLLSSLWVQALTEASEDPIIRRHMRRHLRDVHDFVADVMRRAQEAGWIEPDRDPVAEAWIFISVGLLGAIGQRLGGLAEADIDRIRASRRRWLTGT
jgi:TetR/AcrR family transcriptional regulator